jgi:transcriptional regulator with XRE-family HTH domain
MIENKSFGEVIKALRKSKDMPIRKVAAFIDIDPSSYSKIERNERTISRPCISKLSELFEVPERELLLAFLSNRIAYELLGETDCNEILRVAEQRINYLKSTNVTQKEIQFND